MRTTAILLRRGKPRPRASMFPEKFRRVPAALKPMQGGQPFFQDFLLQSAKEDLELAARAEQRLSAAQRQPLSSSSPSSPGLLESGVNSALGDAALRLPQVDAVGSLEESLRQDLEELRNGGDAFVSQRAFNELEWFERESARKFNDEVAGSSAVVAAPVGVAGAPATTTTTVEPGSAHLPDRVIDNDFFRSRFGYSLVKQSELRPQMEYKDLDLWSELPKYHRDMIFLYVISRRRNTYAVAFDFDGKRLLKPYTVGNRGLKGGDRGFRAEGSTDNGHQVMSMYLNDVIAVIRERRASAGNPLAKDQKIDVVVRVMGFYNGRQGAVRAVQDRSDLFNVRYLEDITPFPMNGPRMPRGVFK